jgi:DNA-binding transcriptional LysR family regulator
MGYMPDLHGLAIGDLRVLCVVADAGSISAAASTLGYTQSGVSRRIAAIERAADTALFVRLPRGVQLTPAGQRLSSHARRLVQALDLAEHELSSGDDRVSSLRVGSFSTANARLLPAILRRLSAGQPDVEVAVREHRTATLIRWLLAGSLDVAIVSDYPAGVIQTDGAVLDHLFDDPIVVALSTQHPLAHTSRLTLRDLAGEAWIEADPSETTVLRAVAQRAGFEARITHRLRDWNGKLGFVAAGLGVAIVPGLAVTGMRSDVALRRLSDDLPTRKVYLATTPASRTLSAVQHLVATAHAVTEELAVTLG